MTPSGSDGTLAWECTECGKFHPKHSPPCSRCGNTSLERTTVDDEELLERARPDPGVDWRMRAAALAAALLAVYLVAGWAGLVPLPVADGDDAGLAGPGGGTPTPIADVPGEGTRASGLDLEGTSAALRDELNDRREDRGHDRLVRDQDLTAMATYHTRHMVKYGHYSGETGNYSYRDLGDAYQPDCDRRVAFFVDRLRGSGTDDRAVDRYDTERALATAFVDRLVADRPTREELFRPYDRVGVDVHVAADGDVYATIVVC